VHPRQLGLGTAQVHDGDLGHPPECAEWPEPDRLVVGVPHGSLGSDSSGNGRS
jgi:hypothetical protein